MVEMMNLNQANDTHQNLFEQNNCQMDTQYTLSQPMNAVQNSDTLVWAAPGTACGPSAENTLSVSELRYLKGYPHSGVPNSTNAT